MPEYLEKIILPCADGSQREVNVADGSVLERIAKEFDATKKVIDDLQSTLSRRSHPHFMSETEFYDAENPFAEGDYIILLSDDTGDVIAGLDNTAGEGQDKIIWCKDPDYNSIVFKPYTTTSGKLQYYDLYLNDSLVYLTSQNVDALKLKFPGSFFDLKYNDYRWKRIKYYPISNMYLHAGISKLIKLPHIGCTTTNFSWLANSTAIDILDIRGIRFTSPIIDNLFNVNRNDRFRINERLITDRQQFLNITEISNFFPRYSHSEPLELYFNDIKLSGSFQFCNFPSLHLHAKTLRLSFTFYFCKLMSEIILDASHIEIIGGQIFDNCELLKTIDLSNSIISTQRLTYLFRGCISLETLRLGSWDLSNLTSAYDNFTNCSSLKNISGDISNLKLSMDLGDCPLSHDSALVFLNALIVPDETNQVLTFSAVTYDTLTESEIATATSKGWIIAKAPETT